MCEHSEETISLMIIRKKKPVNFFQCIYYNTSWKITTNLIASTYTHLVSHSCAGQQLGMKYLGSLVRKSHNSAISVPGRFVVIWRSGAPSSNMHLGGKIQLPKINGLRFPSACMPLARGHSQVSLRSLLCYAAPSIFKADKENLPLTLWNSLTRKSLIWFKDSPH